MEPDDLPSVAALLRRLVPRAEGHALSRRVELLRRLLFENPWFGSASPPLVYEYEGVVVGFIGAHPRPLVVDGRHLQAVWSGPLVSDPDVRAPTGPLLLRAVLAGPQDVTLTDGANPLARQLWERLGGRVSHVRCLSWLHVLRPWRGAAEMLGRNRFARLRRVGGPVLDGLDVVTTRVAGLCPPHPEGAQGAPLDASSFVTLREHGPRAGPRLAYDGASAAWLLDELRRVGEAGSTQRLVLDKDGEPAGWYVAHLPARSIGRVLGIGARGDATGLVVERLLRDAWDAGTAAVTGRVEASLLEPLLETRRPLFSRSERVLVHADDPRLADALVAGEGDLTRLDGEWWMMFHLELSEVGSAPA